MGTERARERCRQRVDRLAGSEQDSESLRREAISELKLAIGFERWCAPLVDPDSLIGHTGVADTDHLPDLARLQLHDASLGEPNNGIAVARRRDRVGRLSAATRGDLARSRRWRETLESYGTGDELRVVAADERGCWGRFDLWRDVDDRPFDADDAGLLRDVSKTLGRALRRASVGPREAAPESPREAGILLVGADLVVRGGTPPIYDWFRVLNPARVPYRDGIPSLVWSTVGRLLAAEQGEEPERPVRIRVRAADGTWAVIEAARLDSLDEAITVSVHAARAADIIDLVFRAYGLTRRECELVSLIVDGRDTGEIAERLVISRYTVQDHLKSVFDKIGVGSRVELVTRVFAQTT